jgi:hypothetical protein
MQAGRGERVDALADARDRRLLRRSRSREDTEDRVWEDLEQLGPGRAQGRVKVETRGDPAGGRRGARAHPRNPDAVLPAECDLSAAGAPELRRQLRVVRVGLGAEPRGSVDGDDRRVRGPGDQRLQLVGGVEAAAGEGAVGLQRDAVQPIRRHVDADDHRRSLTAQDPPGRAE